MVEDSETLYLDELGDGSNLTELAKGTDYEVVSYEDGKFELQDSTALSSYNTTEGDQIVVDYSYEERSSANTVFDEANNAIQLLGEESPSSNL